MKKLLIILTALLIAVPCAYAGTADTAGTWTDQKIFKTGIQGEYIIQIVWHADGTTAAFTETTLNHVVNGYILKAQTIPSPFTDASLSAIATAKGWTEYSPTTLYDIEIHDINDYDVFGGALANLVVATIEENRPIMNGIAGAVESYSPIVLEITGNSVNDALGAIKIWIYRDFTIR